MSPATNEDADLVAAAQRGDRDALDRLLRLHYDRIHAVCRRIAGSTRDADDAAQEALIRIVRALDRFDGRASFATWSYRIATNAALDELRKRSRRPHLHIVGDDDHPSMPEPVDDLAQRRVEAVADRMSVDAALAELPEEFRVRFDLHRYPYELSGGQQQLVSIMRALAVEPEVLFLDEPFSALDYETTLSLRVLLQRVLKERAVTTILVSHDLEESIVLADRLLAHCREVAGRILKNGPLAVSQAKRVIEFGADQDLRAANELERQGFAVLFGSDDQREGMKAFLEKRPAAFTGK